MENDKNEEEMSFSYSKTNTFKEIVMAHLRRITEISCCEFRGGYYTTITDSNGVTKEVYIEDSRERHNNAVLILAYLIFPKFDGDMKKGYDKYLSKLSELRKEFIENSTINEKEILGESFYRDEKDKILLEEFKIHKLKLFQELFLELSKLIAKHNYFEIGGSTY